MVPKLTRDARPRKESVNSGVDRKLLEDAKRLERRKQSEDWLKRNRDALDVYNEFVDQHGVFSNGLRSF
jgi:antitoxin CcdA